MKFKLSKKVLLSSSIVTLSVASLGVFAGVTFAGFSAKEHVNATIASHGVTVNTVYFNANIWEVDNPIYMMKRYSSSEGRALLWVPVSKIITPTIGSTQFVLSIYEYDVNAKVTYNSTAYSLDRFLFVRFNPKGQNLPLAGSNEDLAQAVWNREDITDDDITTSSVWNKTMDIAYNNSNNNGGYNYFCVKNWTNETGSVRKAGLNYSVGGSTWTWNPGEIDCVKL